MEITPTTKMITSWDEKGNTIITKEGKAGTEGWASTQGTYVTPVTLMEPRVTDNYLVRYMHITPTGLYVITNHGAYDLIGDNSILFKY